MTRPANTLARRLAQFQVALMLLTRIPAGRIKGDAPAMGSTTWAWPLVGLVVGSLTAFAFGIAISAGLPPVMAAILALAAGILITGGMHEDGLADLADGFGGGRTRDQKLAIMRDSAIGSYGTMALILNVAIRATAIASHPDPAWALIGLAAASRATLPIALALMPAARADGLGRAATGVAMPPALFAAVFGFFCLMPLGLGTALIAGLTIAFAATCLSALALRQIGGQTGDVMGAMQQTGEVAGWVALVACV
ncbi:MAG: adenosylcobinamide-GDP ribazoletransferase [Rhodobacteraceae bacterium]|nr:adenosylcobinamide-GDP ribazoletransferase [Paracoccaceae bacterium]MCP5341569.1 adenosylcobinamide-GDP ribazoletransferase [Paracoccaceae bacterium]